MNILGVSALYHETAAALVQDGKLVFAVSEERLSRKNKDTSFPVRSIRACLEFAGLQARDIDHVAVGWPSAPSSARHDVKTILRGDSPSTWKSWEHLVVGAAREVRHRGGKLDFERAFGAPNNPIHFIGHHEAHALSSYLMSGFDEASVLIVDGRGSDEATTLWHARGSDLRLIRKYEYPNSLGLFYAGITEVLGFEPLADEWKVMGLASYGEPTIDLTPLLTQRDGTYWVDSRRFLERRLTDIVGPRRNGEEIGQRHKDLARSAQKACEEALLQLVKEITTATGSRNLCLAGGVALNSKANGELLRSGFVDNIYIQPAAGDDGTAIGAAYGVYSRLGLPVPRMPSGHSYLGPASTNEVIEAALQVYKLPYERDANPSRRAAELLAQNRLVGWFQGRMEFGPRALGNRSILADPRFAENRDRVNDAVKFRENWRPFAPSVLADRAAEYFDDFYPSPYMILTFWANKKKAHEIPAVVHVDGSARVQSVERAVNPRYYDLIEEFGRLTGVPIVMNTSFNLKGDPIVCTPKDAIQTFYTSGLDDLVIGDYVVHKTPPAKRS
ncbi:MAG: carbamoyltransferase [Polyangiaceae bacterium]